MQLLLWARFCKSPPTPNCRKISSAMDQAEDKYRFTREAVNQPKSPDEQLANGTVVKLRYDPALKRHAEEGPFILMYAAAASRS